MDVDVDEALRAVYGRLLAAWNAADATAFADEFAEDGEVVGFDGSRMSGRGSIRTELASIFADHATGRYVGIPGTVRPLGPDAAVLLAVSGVVPAGADQIRPELNAVQSLVGQRQDDGWRVVLYSNTPAAFHGRPHLVAELTEQLTRALRADQG
jgi:uncharacterized protein (TIGR02246 family)